MIALVAAVAKGNAIGRKNEIPWHIPEDFKHFKDLTIGHVVLMGRKTFESILERLGKPLPGRTNVVVTRDQNYKVPSGVSVCHSIEEALQAFRDKDIFVIGGGEIYAKTIERADILYITHIDKDVPDADAFFPEISSSVWQSIEEEPREGFRFVTYKRKT